MFKSITFNSIKFSTVTFETMELFCVIKCLKCLGLFSHWDITGFPMFKFASWKVTAGVTTEKCMRNDLFWWCCFFFLLLLLLFCCFCFFVVVVVVVVVVAAAICDLIPDYFLLSLLSPSSFLLLFSVHFWAEIGEYYEAGRLVQNVGTGNTENIKIKGLHRLVINEDFVNDFCYWMS